MNESINFGVQNSGSDDEEAPSMKNSYADFEQDKLAKEVMGEVARKHHQQEIELPEYMKELKVAKIDNQVFPESFYAEQ